MKKRRNPHLTPGYRHWACYRPGRRNLYQLQEVTSTSGDITNLSPWMELMEVRAFIAGWRYSGSKKKLPPFRREK